MQRYWCSWESGEDPRPTTYPPNESIIGWWCSGESLDGSVTTVVALIQAKDEKHARKAVSLDWPEMKTAGWRFIERVDDDFLPGDRFPLSPWMKKRAALGATRPTSPRGGGK